MTADDIQRVANTYFDRKNRAVAVYTRSADAAPIDPELAALPAEVQGMVQQQLAQLASITDPAQLEQVLTMMGAQAAQVPPEFKPALDYLQKKVRERIAELNESN